MRWLCTCFALLGIGLLYLWLAHHNHESKELITWTLTKSSATYNSFRYRNCSSSTCLRSQPCMLNYRYISIYIQPILKVVDEEGTVLTPVPSREFYSVRSFLQMYSVQEPEEACIVFPGVDFLNLYRFPSIDAAHVIAHMITERFYNVLIFTVVGQWNYGFRHILASSTTSQTIYRHGLDIPLPPYRIGSSASSQSNTMKHKFVVPLFNVPLSFQEESLRVFSDFEGVTLLTECFDQKSLVCDISGNKVNWEDALQNAKFVLVHERMPHFELALYRALEASVIPVIFAPNYILPFFEYVDWHSLALFPSSLTRVVDVINSLSTSKLEAMHGEIRNVFFHFSSLQGIVNMTVHVLESRLLAKKTRYSKRWSALSEKPFALPRFESATQMLLLAESDMFGISQTLQLVRKLAPSGLLSSATIIWRDVRNTPSFAVDDWRSVFPVEIVTGISQLRDFHSVITQIKTDVLLLVPLGVCSLDSNILKKALNVCFRFIQGNASSVLVLVGSRRYGTNNQLVLCHNSFHIWRTTPDRAVVLPCFGSSFSAVIVHRMLLTFKSVDQQAVTNSRSLFEEIPNMYPSLHVIIEDYINASSLGQTSLKHDRVLI